MATATLDDRSTHPIPPRKAVLLVGNFLSESIGRRHTCECLAERLAQAGWSVLTASRHPARIARVSDMIETAWARRRDYDVGHVDVFSGQAFAWAEAVCWTMRRVGKPYVLSLHGGTLPEFAASRPRRVRSLLRSAALVTSPSRYLRERLHAYRDDILLVPNPIDVDHYPFRLRTPARPHLTWLRAFHEVYNPTLAVTTIGLLVDEFPEIRLDMIGPDKKDHSLRAAMAEADRLGIRGRIRFSGGVSKSEVPRRLDEADIFLNTSNADNTPVSLLEALACGLCTVSTDVGGLPYLLDSGRNALLVPPNAPEAMADAVRRLLRDPNLAGRLSREARVKAEGCGWDAILPLWDGLFDEVAGHPHTQSLRSRG